MPPEFKFLTGLLAYGPLGIFTIIFVILYIRKDRQIGEERAAHTKEMRDQQIEHAKEMRALEERYVTKTETWVMKYQDLAQAQDATIKALRALVKND